MIGKYVLLASTEYSRQKKNKKTVVEKKIDHYIQKLFKPKCITSRW